MWVVTDSPPYNNCVLSIFKKKIKSNNHKSISTQKKKFEIRSSPQRARESKSGCVRSMYSLDSQEQSFGFEDH